MGAVISLNRLDCSVQQTSALKEAFKESNEGDSGPDANVTADVSEGHFGLEYETFVLEYIRNSCAHRESELIAEKSPM